MVSQTNFLYICKGMNSFYLIYAKVIAMFLFFLEIFQFIKKLFKFRGS